VHIFFLPYLNKNYKIFWISLTLAEYPAGYPALPDIRQGNLLSGRIPDIKKGRIIRPDIRPAGYLVHPYWLQHGYKLVSEKFLVPANLVNPLPYIDKTYIIKVLTFPGAIFKNKNQRGP
jgi:hypothetical protein